MPIPTRCPSKPTGDRPANNLAVARLVSGAITLILCFSRPSVLPAQQDQPSANHARLTFTKVLKGSSPEYVAITVDSSGIGTYEGRKLDEPPAPRDLRLSPSTTRRLFELSALLNDFRSIDLESHKKVANMGLKTLIYEEGTQRNSAEFNYTLRREAQELTDTFERIASVEQHVAALEFATRYDHLSLPRELLQIQADLDNKALTEARLMVPALERIARNPKFLRLAQLRAQNILDRLQTQTAGTRN